MNWKQGIKIISKIPATQTIMLKGVHGVGKTEFVQQICKDVWKLPCVVLQGSQLSDVGDLIGLQRINEKTGHTEWVPPYWFHSSDEPFCLFLDEINRADAPIRKAMMQMGLEQRILNFKLPAGSRVICAVNPSETGTYDVEEISDDAEKDRFKVYTFDPTVDEWLDYAIAHKFNEFVIGYISQNTFDLDPYKNKENAKVSGKGSFDGILPSRRTWKHLSDALNESFSDDDYEGVENLDLLEQFVAGYVGSTIASKFRHYVVNNAVGLSPKNVIEADDFKKIAKKIEKLGKASKIEVVNLGHGISTFFKNNEDLMKDETYAKRAANNFYNFLKTIKPEPRAEIYTNCVENDMKQSWVKQTAKLQPKLKELYYEIADADI